MKIVTRPPLQLVLFACFALVSLAPTVVTGQSSKAATQQAQPSLEAFSISTGSERWCLDDAPPASTVLCAGKSLSLADRLVAESTSGAGERQLLFPVSWYEPYMAQNPELKYVVVRYDKAGARMIMAEYMPEKFSLPKAEFVYDANGKRFYRNLSVLRKAGRTYVKQAVASGKESADGGYWIDMMLMYSTDETAAAKPAVRKP